MSLSVISNPNTYYTIYSDQGTLNEVPNIVTNSIAAYKNDSGVATTLTLGASGNLLIETVQDIRSYMGISNAYRLYTATYDSNTSTRTDTEILNVTSAASNVTLFSTPSNITFSPNNSALSTITLGSFQVSESGTQQVLSTTLNNFLLQDGLAVAGDVSIGNNLYTTGNIYGANVNLWSDRANKPYNRIGYGFRINSNDQLEIIKYAKFNNNDVLKRIAVFGQGALGSNDSSDMTASNYLVFNSLGQVSVAGSGGSLNPIASTSATSGTDMTLSGTTSLSGNIVPTVNGVSAMGTSNAYMYSVSASNFLLPDSLIGTSNIYFTTNSNNAPFIGMGTAIPQYKLHVVGTVFASQDIVASSDQRLKENITVIPSALEKVKQISGYTFNRIGDPTRCTGVIAQELQAVLPEAVSTDSYGYLSVAYGNVVGLLIEAIKELSAKVNV